MTQLEILNSRAIQYGYFMDNAVFVNAFKDLTHIKLINMRINTSKYNEFNSITNLTKIMTGLKLIRLSHAVSIESIEDCIKDYFNYWYLCIKDLLSICEITDMDTHFVYIEFNEKELFSNKEISRSKNIKYIENCVNLIKERKWNKNNYYELMELASAVVDLYTSSQNTINDDINLFNYEEKLNKRK